MKKRNKVFTLLFLMVFVSGLLSNCFAYEVSVDYSTMTSSQYHWDGTNYFEYNGENSWYKYMFKDGASTKTVYCIDPDHPFWANVRYNEVTDDASCKISAETRARVTAMILYGSYKEQVRQMAIWCLSTGIQPGNSAITVHDSTQNAKLSELYNYVMNELTWDEGSRRLKKVTSGGEISANASSLSFSYQLDIDAYVSNTVSVTCASPVSLDLEEAPSGSWIDGSSASFRVIVPRESFSGTQNVRVKFSSAGASTYTYYTPGTEYHGFEMDSDGSSVDGVVQEVITAGSTGTDSLTTSGTVSGSVTRPLGNLKVAKKNKHGEFVAGAKFLITGPSDIPADKRVSITVITGEGYSEYNNLDCGKYTVKEIDAPTGMVLKTSSVKATVTNGGTAYSIIENEYQRGSVTLTKYDADGRGENNAWVSRAGAVYKLYPVGTIKEGNTTIHPEGVAIRTVTTNADGTTEVIENLPIGQYYYQEITPSRGFKLNGDKVYVTVRANTQTEAKAQNDAKQAPEYKIKVNLRIKKRLAATECDPEITLAGSKFRITLLKADGTKDTTQVYESNITGDDGIAEIFNVFYGKYYLEEIQHPDSSYNMTPMTIDFTESAGATDGKLYEITKVNPVKTMDFDITKQMKLNPGETTEAKVSGAIFTVYRDAACTVPFIDKNGQVVTVGPTDANGYAKSRTMRTGTYYVKETTFPEGVDKDLEIPGEGVKYKDKVYTVSANNRTQGADTIHLHYTVQNEPIRNDIEIWKMAEATTNVEEFSVEGARFRAKANPQNGTTSNYYKDCEAPTTVDGYCVIKDLPYGHYIVTETENNPITLKCSDFKVFINKNKAQKPGTYKASDPETEWVEPNAEHRDWAKPVGKLVDDTKKMNMKVIKYDKDGYNGGEAPDYTQGDAKLEGARYHLYRYNETTREYDIDEGYKETVYDATGKYWYVEWLDYITAKYKVVEDCAREEDGFKYSYAEGYLIDEVIHYFEQDPATQTQERVNKEDKSLENVVRGRVSVIKQDNVGGHTEEVASTGATLKLTLDKSNGEIYYTTRINEYGWAEFKDINDDTHTASVTTCYGSQYDPNTIPYGKYTLTEIDSDDGVYPSKHTVWYTQPQDVYVRQEHVELPYILSDNPVLVRVIIEKRDEDTSKKVALPGAEFMIWDCQLKQFITQKIALSNIDTDVFITNDEGYLELPHNIEAGVYILYEVNAPESYYLEDRYKIPLLENGEIDMSKIGDEAKAGKKFSLNKETLNIPSESVTPGDYAVENVAVYYTMDISDRPLKTKLIIHKYGEKFTDVIEDTVSIRDNYETQRQPEFTKVPMEGAEFEITAVNDIYSKDGTHKYVSAGESWTFRSGSDGIAETEELYPGKYRVVETYTPRGYKTIDPFEIELKSEDQNKRVEKQDEFKEDVFQTVNIELEKEFHKNAAPNNPIYRPEDKLEEEPAYAIFGIFADEDLTNIYGTKTITEGSLIKVVEIHEGEKANINVKLPDGKYYVRELYVTDPYEPMDQDVKFEIRHSDADHTSDTLDIKVEKMNNWPRFADLKMIKLSSSYFVVNGNIVASTAEDDRLTIEAARKELIKQVNLQLDEGEDIRDILRTLEGDENHLLVGAEYQVYVDEGLTTHLQVSYDNGVTFENVVLKSEKTIDETGHEAYNGLYSLDGIPAGKYYLKETVAPEYEGEDGNHYTYDLNPDPVEVLVRVNNFLIENKVMFNVLLDVAPSLPVHKSDIFTSDDVEDCVFIIYDEDGDTKLKFKTNEEGQAEIPVDILEEGKKYYYQEIEAPNIYKQFGKMVELNTEPHEFMVEFDEEGHLIKNPIEIENVRPYRELIIRKTDEDTGEPLQGCVFDIALLDSEGNPYVNKNGEVVYLVKGAVTDENGEYKIEKAYYGSYKFTEVETPEGYDKAQQAMLDYTFTISDESPDTIIFEVTNTGDIAVYAIAALAVVSILGIVFVISKNKKATSK